MKLDELKWERHNNIGVVGWEFARIPAGVLARSTSPNARVGPTPAPPGTVAFSSNGCDGYAIIDLLIAECLAHEALSREEKENGKASQSCSA